MIFVFWILGVFVVQFSLLGFCFGFLMKFLVDSFYSGFGKMYFIDHDINSKPRLSPLSQGRSVLLRFMYN